MLSELSDPSPPNLDPSEPPSLQPSPTKHPTIARSQGVQPGVRVGSFRGEDDDDCEPAKVNINP